LTQENQSRDTDQRTPAVARVALLLLLLCSLFFAFYKSNSAFGSDEVWSIKTAGMTYSSEMAALKADVHPPLYYQILFVWLRLFGTGERAVRSLSGLFFVLCVFSVYGMGRDLYGYKTALLCATIYLSSPLAILSAQFARMYALLSLLSVLSTWLYLRFSTSTRDTRLSFALYIAINVLGTFTHVAFFFVLFGQIFFHTVFHRPLRLKKFIVAILLSLFPYLLLWAPILLNQITKSGENLAWINRPDLSSIAELLLLYGGAFWLLLPVLLYLWWRSGFRSLSSFSKLSRTSLPLWLMATTVLTPLLISEVRPIFSSRFAIIGLPFFALTIGAFIGKASNYFLPIELVVLSSIGLLILHPGTAACNNRAIASYLNQTSNDDDVVIFTSLTRLPIDYYLQQARTKRKLFETTFPAEIDSHPGYEGRVTDPGRRAALETEAQELVNKISMLKLSAPDLRVFFLHGFHPDIDSIVEKRLRERFELLPAQGVRCREASSYFKEASVYK
jgi:4-amino-4-deoxy-L-arabinose transferase-like glycosyltransferase